MSTGFVLLSSVAFKLASGGLEIHFDAFLPPWLCFIWLIYNAVDLATRALQQLFPGFCDMPPPRSFVCPLTKELMRGPVVCVDGYSYERAAIEKWMADNREYPTVWNFDNYPGRVPSPVSGVELLPSHLFDNCELCSAIKQWTASGRGLRGVLRRHLPALWRILNSRTPPFFRCPITGKLMRDPVITNQGDSFERSAIETYLDTAGLRREQQVSPEPDSIGWEMQGGEMRFAPNTPYWPNELVVYSPRTGKEIRGENVWTWPNHALRDAIEQWHC